MALGYTNERFSLGAQPQLICAMVDDHLFSSRRGIVLLAGSASAEAKITDALSWTSHGAWQYTQEKLRPGSLLFCTYYVSPNLVVKVAGSVFGCHQKILGRSPARCDPPSK